MKLTRFMQEKFPDLELRPPLFYNWDIGIRFELGVGWERGMAYYDSPYLLGCYKRAITLFEAIHKPTDDIFVVIDVLDLKRGKTINRELQNFSPYVEKSLLYRVKHQTLPFIYPEDDEDGAFKTQRFTLKCKAGEVKYKPLLKALCNTDLGLKPLIYHRVYFVNINQETIYHVYDDRGSDLLATSPETIRSIYNKFNEWILDYDRNEIDEVFS
ncbi:DUF3885 domain-containing protein [Planococcus sp. N028]|uniref:DUF3885 domain-containing protein n=2 Tax=Planococcus shixiaomingii TaxID=3058393 RepID=A0ABT8MYG7_9BACL|nr:DUF3885 domain-containing protein [Planococcus sp. N028]